MFSANTILNEVKRYRALADGHLTDARAVRGLFSRRLRESILISADKCVMAIRALMILLSRCSDDSEDHRAAVEARRIMLAVTDDIDRLRGKAVRDHAMPPGFEEAMADMGERDYGTMMEALERWASTSRSDSRGSDRK